MLIENLSVLKIKNTLLVTVPDDPSDSIICELQDKVLSAIEQYETKHVILDISRVYVWDSFFARTIAETTDMVGLMGSDSILVGMRPSVAVTAIELGLTIGNALPLLDVDQAFEMLQNLSKE